MFVVATLAGARNYREIATMVSEICPLLARLDYFRKCYRCPRRTVIWAVLESVDAAELDRVADQWLLAQARYYR